MKPLKKKKKLNPIEFQPRPIIKCVGALISRVEQYMSYGQQKGKIYPDLRLKPSVNFLHFMFPRLLKKSTYDMCSNNRCPYITKYSRSDLRKRLRVHG